MSQKSTSGAPATYSHATGSQSRALSQSYIPCAAALHAAGSPATGLYTAITAHVRLLRFSGSQAKGITLSPKQAARANVLSAKAGLAERVSFQVRPRSAAGGRRAARRQRCEELQGCAPPHHPCTPATKMSTLLIVKCKAAVGAAGRSPLCFFSGGRAFTSNACCAVEQRTYIWCHV